MPNTKFRISDFGFRIWQFKKGFTLIELLIVISIIGILASLTLASYGSAQAKARDGVRKSDLAQMKRALELYKADCDSGSWYPYITDTQIQTGSNLSLLLLQTNAGTPVPYMNPVPKDPTNSTTNTPPLVYKYTPGAAGSADVCPTNAGVSAALQGTSNYFLSMQLERVNDSDGLKSYTACSSKPGMPGTYPVGMYYVCNN